jgi:glycosyltransferase involved in cell wall biosynthesis
MTALMVSPEPPYPLQGGGAFRIASLLHFFARIADVDLILISESGTPALVPAGLVRSQQVIPLPYHSRHSAARYFRNARRAIKGVPPLIERVGGLGDAIQRAIAGRHYDFGIVEHFWCAPYIEQLSGCCDTTILDLHNIESVLDERCAAVTSGLIRAGHSRFASAYRRLEADLLPRYSMVLAPSQEDAATARRIAPSAKVEIYPNSLPWIKLPQIADSPCLVFSGNFEYHPNIDAVAFLVRDIWPVIQRSCPGVRLRLVGRGDRYIRHLIPRGSAAQTGIEVTGPVEDALPEIAQARVVVAPLRAGSGTRIKILEAWAAARCVVATPLAAEGLDTRNGTNISLAASASDFAAEVVRLLGDGPARESIGSHGRATFEACYTWKNVWKTLYIILQLTKQPRVNGYTGEN